MENKGEEDNSMCEKILTRIQHFFTGNYFIREFTIVPIIEGTNTSPVLYEEHCLGLELWCVKHLYRYIYTELFQLKPLYRKHKLFPQELERVNNLLICALLLHPDITTFWNMRRELVEKGVTTNEKELLLTKLVLSHKSKSNECFAYRKWIINKLMKNTMSNNDIVRLLNIEFIVSEMAANKATNNYHAWSHRIWCIQNIITKSGFMESDSYLKMIFSELNFADTWIEKHVSEHSGFHYRQFLTNNILKNKVQTEIPKSEILRLPFLFECVDINSSVYDSLPYLNKLLGEQENHSHHTPLKCYNYLRYFIILLSDLFYYDELLNETYPGHEAIWYHRRYLVFSILKGAYDYHNLTWKKASALNVSTALPNDLNIANADINVFETGEKSAKLLKYDSNKVESCCLYKLVVEGEINIKKNIFNMSSHLQKEFAERHRKWLNVLGFNKICF